MKNMKKSKLLKFIKRHKDIIYVILFSILIYIIANRIFSGILTQIVIIGSYLLGYWNTNKTQSIQIIKTSYTPEEAAKDERINRIRLSNNTSCPECGSLLIHDLVDGSHGCQSCCCNWR